MKIKSAGCELKVRFALKVRLIDEKCELLTKSEWYGWSSLYIYKQCQFMLINLFDNFVPGP